MYDRIEAIDARLAILGRQVAQLRQSGPRWANEGGMTETAYDTGPLVRAAIQNLHVEQLQLLAERVVLVELLKGE